LAIGTAIPREVGGTSSGTAAVRRGRVTMKRVEKKYMLERTGKVYVKGSDEDCRPPGIRGALQVFISAEGVIP
jgi:hypothetical protein